MDSLFKVEKYIPKIYFGCFLIKLISVQKIILKPKHAKVLIQLCYVSVRLKKVWL